VFICVHLGDNDLILLGTECISKLIINLFAKDERRVEKRKIKNVPGWREKKKGRRAKNVTARFVRLTGARF